MTKFNIIDQKIFEHSFSTKSVGRNIGTFLIRKVNFEFDNQKEAKLL